MILQLYRIVESLRAERDLTRTIVHVDMDMYYAAVEMRDNPALRDVPMAVGGMGMLSTSNYAARKFGVRAAMPGFIAKKLCPNLVIVPGNMEKYAAVSGVVRGVFREYDANFAPMSLDEAYLDITELLSRHQGDKDSQETAWSIVNEMRSKIHERTQLTASAGIAPNCFLAKVCSDLNKPNGQYELRPDPEEVIEFVSGLAIRKVGGIGNVQEQLLKGLGVQTCRDLYAKRAEIRLLFSELSFEFYLAVSQGIGSSRIEPPEDRERKSISTETTFSDNSDRDSLLAILRDLCKDLSSDCQTKGITGQAVTVKIKSHDFKLKTKVSQLCDFSNDEELIHATAKKILLFLLDNSEEQPLALRLMGVRLSGLQDKESAASKPRQKNILTFMKDPPTPGSSVVSSEANVSETKYSCPICTRDCESLFELNNHIDKCLEPVEEAKSGSSIILQKEKETIDSAIATTSEEENRDIERKPAKSFFRRKMEEMEKERDADTIRVSETEVIPAVLDEVKASEPIRKAKEESLSCPVCFKVTFEDETLMSSHVEECLSKQAIADILSSERATKAINNNTNKLVSNKKRKTERSPHKSSKVDKRPKTEQSTKIDFFFKLKS